MKLIMCVALLCLTSTANATPFANGSVENGKTLIAEYECNNCHAAKVGGDGSAIFNRSNSKVYNANEISKQITLCSNSMNLNAKEKLDIGAYLNQMYYHFR